MLPVDAHCPYSASDAIMGIYDRPYLHDEKQPSVGPRAPRTMVGRLIVINAVVYLAIILTGQAASPVLAAMEASGQFATQPLQWYRFISYAFAHDPFGMGHVFWNMFGLFMFGSEVESIYGGKRMLRLYLITALLGGIIWTLVAFATKQGASMIGASGAVTAMVILFCFHYPKRRIYLFMLLPIPAWILGVMQVLGDLSGTLRAQSSGGPRVAFEVHLVGAICGALYYLYHRQIDQFLDRCGSVFSGRLLRRPGSGARPKLKVFRSESPGDSRLARDADRILEKLHREGEASLTARERGILETYSRQMRDRRS